jgi:hypothetical protein
VSLTSNPVYPLPNRPCSLAFAATSPSANFVRIWFTNAPLTSAVRAKIDKSEDGRELLFAGDPSQWGAIKFTPDKGGIYTVAVQEYSKGAASYGGAYEGDPGGAPTETLLGTVTSATVHVGQRVTQPVGYGQDTATLAFWIFNDSIHRTNFATHGEVTPSVNKPASTKAALACESLAVQVLTGNIAEQTVASAIGNIATIGLDFLTTINSHLIDPGPHHATDTDNTLTTGLATDVSPKSFPGLVNQILVTLRNHFQNIDPDGDVGVPPGVVDGANYHETSSVKRNDRRNLPVVESAGDVAAAYAALGDIARCYEAHRLNTGVHGSADTTNVLASLPAVLRLHKAFFEAIAQSAPTAPSTVNSGVVTAVATAGFKES